MINPRMVTVQYWSCGCVTYNLSDKNSDAHTLHPHSFIAAIETKLVDWITNVF